MPNQQTGVGPLTWSFFHIANSNVSSDFQVRTIPEKGRGVFCTREMKKGEMICEYAGDLIDYDLAKKREKDYGKDPELGCYMYFFEYKSKKYW